MKIHSTPFKEAVRICEANAWYRDSEPDAYAKIAENIDMDRFNAICALTNYVYAPAAKWYTEYTTYGIKHTLAHYGLGYISVYECNLAFVALGFEAKCAMFTDPWDGSPASNLLVRAKIRPGFVQALREAYEEQRPDHGTRPNLMQQARDVFMDIPYDEYKGAPIWHPNRAEGV